MNIDFNVPCVDFKGEVIKDGNEKEIPTDELLLNAIGVAKAKDGKEVIEIYKLGVKIASKETEFDVDELSLLKRLIEESENLTILFKGQILEMINKK